MPRKRSPHHPTRRTGPPVRTGAVLLSTGLSLMALAQAAPANAASDASTASVQWSTGGDIFRGTIPLRATVSADGPVEGWLVRLLDTQGHTVVKSLCDGSFLDQWGSVNDNDYATAARTADGRLAANQHYLVRILTRHDRSVTAAGPDFAASTANPAAAPDDFKVKTRNGATVLSWAANREPDVLHYDVDEQIDAQKWTRIGEADDTTFEPPAGPAHRTFRVAAERQGPDGGVVGPERWATVVADSAGPESGDTAAKRASDGDEVAPPPARKGVSWWMCELGNTSSRPAGVPRVPAGTRPSSIMSFIASERHCGMFQNSSPASSWV